MARILAVTSRLPFPPREGHQLRSWHLLKAMAARHEVTLLSVTRDDDDLDAVPAMRKLLAGVETFPLAAAHSRLALGAALARGVLAREPVVVAKYASRALRARIAALAPGADLVHFDMLPLMRHADAVPAGIPVAYNAHNVEHALLATRAGIRGGGARAALESAFLRTQVPRLRAFERRACARADVVLACSPDDATALRALAPGTRVEVVANGVDLDANRPAPTDAGGEGMVFVGQMGWFPNRDGVDWFLREVLPRIAARRPGARFVLVGKPGDLEVPADIAGHVALAGFVPDLRPLVHDAAVYVVPLRAGSGTRLKVLEAMALGKAIVTTSIGSEGIALRHGDSALYADDADAFAAAVLSLFDDPALRARLAASARATAERLYGWDAIGRDLLAHYDGLLAATFARHATAACQKPAAAHA